MRCFCLVLQQFANSFWNIGILEKGNLSEQKKKNWREKN
jgi:hypothetical protein